MLVKESKSIGFCRVKRNIPFSDYLKRLKWSLQVRYRKKAFFQAVKPYEREQFNFDLIVIILIFQLVNSYV